MAKEPDLFNDECMGRAINPEIGGSPVKVRWEVEVTEGPHKGKRARYSGKLDDKNIRFTKRDMIKVGWQGKSAKTFVADVRAANRVVPFLAEIASYDGSQWTSAKYGSSLAPVEDFDKVDRWLAEAGDAASEKPANDDGDAPF